MAKARRGAAVVEMAMCLPILFLLLFGCYEFARANMMRHAVEAAAYEGARTGITPGASSSDVRSSVSRILASVGVSNANIDVTPDPIPLRAPTVRVEVELRMRDNTTIPLLFNERTRLSGKCELSRETGF